MDLLINGIKVTSIVFAGMFGMLGLLTKYKDGDKITRWGKFALAGIVLSAFLSLSLQLLQTAKETRKHEAEAIRASQEAQKAEQASKATSTRLAEILTTAQTTSAQQSENLSQAQIITGKMDTSLKAQDKVLTGNKQILSGVVEGTKADTRNTIGVLRTIWDESNRVEANQISVTITYTFAREVTQPPPVLMEHGESLSLAVGSAEATVKRNAPPNRWSSTHLLDKPDLLLHAKEHKISRKEHRTVDGISYEQTSYFSGFEGDVKTFSDMTKWNGALTEVVLTKQEPNLAKKFQAIMDWQPEHAHDLEVLKQTYDIPADLEENDYQITPMPVKARLVIYIRERPIVSSTAWLVGAWEHDEDVRGLIVAKFTIARIADNTFPEFRATL